MNAPLTSPIPHILVVDDSPANVTLLLKMLLDKGYSVQGVPSGALALQAARASAPDLILLDINMPLMDGFEVCKQLKADADLREIPVIFLSSRDDASDKVRAFGIGGVDYVTKPFHFDEVFARVQTHLQIRALQYQLDQHNQSLALQVAERTQALEKAYQRVQELSQLKDDFLRMISHEMRTPANGVLGVGDLLINLCPASAKRTRYASLFTRSSERLLNLLDDVTLISGIETLIPNTGEVTRFSDLLLQVRCDLEDQLISMLKSPELDAVFIKGYLPLIKKALTTMLRIGFSFSVNKNFAQLTWVVNEATLGLRLEVDALMLSSEQVAEFFMIGSQVRSVSPAEPMGLAPVVAHQIITALGGELRLIKGDDNTGYLEAFFLLDPCPDLAQRSAP